MLASLGHPSKFQRVSRLGSVTARQSSSGRQPNFAAFNKGRQLCSAGRPSRWALAHTSSSFFLSPAIGDWMSTILPHMVCLSANLECMSEMCCMRLAEIQNAKMSQKNRHLHGHHRTSLSRCIFDNRKKLVKQQYLRHMSPTIR